MNEKILVNGIPVFSSYIVHLEDKIKVYIDFEEEDNQGQTSSCEVVSLDFRKNN